MYGRRSVFAVQAGSGLAESSLGNDLIPTRDPVSDLLEDIRLERSSYEILDGVSGIEADAQAGGDLVGLVIVQGQVEIRCGAGHVERLDPTDFMLLTPWQSYSIRALNGAPCTVGRVTYGFDMSRARLMFRLLPPRLVIRGLEQRDIDWQMDLARLICEHKGANGPANAAINRRLVEASLICVIQKFLMRDPELERQLTTRLLAELGPSLQAMHAFPERHWTVASLARLSGMSRTLFAARFAESVGETPARYLAGLRMQRARDLLSRSQMSLAAIAHEAGYGTDAAFARAFKREFGLPPGRFRATAH